MTFWRVRVSVSPGGYLGAPKRRIPPRGGSKEASSKVRASTVRCVACVVSGVVHRRQISKPVVHQVVRRSSWREGARRDRIGTCSTSSPGLSCQLLGTLFSETPLEPSRGVIPAVTSPRLLRGFASRSHCLASGKGWVSRVRRFCEVVPACTSASRRPWSSFVCEGSLSLPHPFGALPVDLPGKCHQNHFDRSASLSESPNARQAWSDGHIDVDVWLEPAETGLGVIGPFVVLVGNHVL